MKTALMALAALTACAVAFAREDDDRAKQFRVGAVGDGSVDRAGCDPAE